jgi:hypothetical protein
MFIGDEDIKRINDIDKRDRRVLAVFCDSLLRIDYHDKIIRIAFVVDFGLLSKRISLESGKCGEAGSAGGAGRYMSFSARHDVLRIGMDALRNANRR